MELVLDELRKAMKYHQRQLEENLHKITSKEESIKQLHEANEKHWESIQQLLKVIEMLEKDIAVTMPIEKESNGIITEGEAV